MHLVETSSGRRFEARSDETLLEAALRQGVVLGYSCRNGRCSSCKAQLIAGSTIASRDESGLSTADVSAGFILTCVRRACSDVQLGVDDFGDLGLPEARTLPCRVHTIDRVGPDVAQVVLRLPPSSALTFLPGQYVDVIGPDGLRRSYSLANAARPDGLLELHIRAVPGGAMSQYWFGKAKIHDLLRLRGPLGTFFLRGQAGRDLVLLATGTGIAPVKAIIESLQRLPSNALPRSVVIYWGNREVSDLYWQPPADVSAKFVPVLSRARPDWCGRRGHVQDVLLRDMPDLSNVLVYACGSDAMIRSAQEKLLAKGLPAERFHSDAFVCSA